MKVGIIRTQSRIALHINGANRKLSAVPNEAHKFFQKATPIKTGNARSKTTLANDTVNARYPYAQRLDTGYSKQSPRGMSKPTLVFVRKLVNKILGR